MNQLTGLILVLLFFAFLLRVDFIFYVAYVCIGLYAWSRWRTPRVLAQLKVGRFYSSHAFWGKKVDVAVRVENQSRLPVPWLQLADSVAVELRSGVSLNRVVALRGHAAAEVQYQIQGRQRGYYQLGPMRLATNDLFGLLPEQVGMVAAEYITVYPRIIPLTQLGLPSRLPFGTVSSQQRLFEDPARPMGVRDYRSGDSLRQINWKASAHTRQLVVKTFQPAISLETAVLLNLHSADYSRQNRRTIVEWGIEVAASLAAHLIDQRQAVGLLTNGIDPLQLAGADAAQFDDVSGRLLQKDAAALRTENPQALLPPKLLPGNGRAHLMKLLERLARIESEETISFVQWAPTACAPLSWGVTLLAITARGDLETSQALHRLARAGFNPVLIAIEPDHNFGLVRERGRRLGFQAFNVSRQQDLDQWRTRAQSWEA